jgi:site-specific recombinase XerD
VTDEISTKRQHELSDLGFAGVPKMVSGAGKRASYRFIEFFTANIRNPNTRVSYGRAVREFCHWCEERGLALEDLNPVLVAGYIEQLGRSQDKNGRGYSKPSVKQHLAAIRMLFDYLVTGGILPMNPASSVRGPKYSIKRGKTPVLSAEEARQLLDSIGTDTIIGLRDRALIGVMVYSFSRVSAAVSMRVEDYFQAGKRWKFRFMEKGAFGNYPGPISAFKFGPPQGD